MKKEIEVKFDDVEWLYSPNWEYFDYGNCKRHLQVYQRNARAIRFYQREGFRIQNEGMDEHTGEKDYTMVWERKREPKSLE